MNPDEMAEKLNEVFGVNLPMPEFVAFPKIPRLSRPCIITEKIDGTNGQIVIADDGKSLVVGSRNRWLSQHEDNHGFFRWAYKNAEQLIHELGPGRHYGEWWGHGIGKRYHGAPKQFSLFNTARWLEPKLNGKLTVCGVVPLLYEGPFSTEAAERELEMLDGGSYAWGPCKNPEGIVIFHAASNYLFKKTLVDDDNRRSDVQA